LENLYAKSSTQDVIVNRGDTPPRMVAPAVVLAAALLVLGLGNSIIVTQVLEPIAGGFYRR
jgi:hypothetical protein